MEVWGWLRHNANFIEIDNTPRVPRQISTNAAAIFMCSFIIFNLPSVSVWAGVFRSNDNKFIAMALNILFLLNMQQCTMGQA